MINIPILVFTSDKYLNALKGFSFLFNKYWNGNSPQPVTIVGFGNPKFELPENFQFYSMGSQRNYPLDKWSDAIIDYLTDKPFDHFILMLEDYWVTRPVDVRSVKILADYCVQFQNVLKMDLCGDRLYSLNASPYGNVAHIDLIKSSPDSQYHMSLMTGIWNRKLLLSFLVRGETPWDVELRGTPRVSTAGDNILVLGTRQWPVRHTLAHRRGNPSELFLDEINSVDVSEMKNIGAI